MMSTTKSMSTTLRLEDIEATMQSLPIQNRTMLQLLLLQYMDISQESIDYIAAEQPDSRMLAGNQAQGRPISVEAAQNVIARANQYKGYYRQKRERPGMHIEFLSQSLTIMDRTIHIAERLLTSDFEVDESVRQTAKIQAPSLLLRQEQRKLQWAWDNEELSVKDYQTQRLLLEYQALLRRRGIFRRRLKFAQQDFVTAGISPLKDHEVAHIWGIPMGSLVARKVKALQQFLSGLQQKLGRPLDPNSPSQFIDLWQETLHVLSQRSFERSIVEYDGLEKTEEILMDKLRAFINGSMSEPEESKFWTSITRVNDTEFSGTWHSNARSILAFQRLHALLNDMDCSDEALEEELRAKIYPKLPEDQLATPESEEKPVELGEMGLGVLSAFAGEQDDKRKG